MPGMVCQPAGWGLVGASGKGSVEEGPVGGGGGGECVRVCVCVCVHACVGNGFYADTMKHTRTEGRTDEKRIWVDRPNKDRLNKAQHQENMGLKIG